jgi:CubicO group peptidase (beta-lactamase class C family)
MLFRCILMTLPLLFTPLALAAETGNFDYFKANRLLIRNGLQAVLMCNGLFTSHRSLELVFSQELAYVHHVVGTAEGGDYLIDSRLRAVTVGGGASGTPVSAVFREGLGCIVLAPDQKPGDNRDLPELALPYPGVDPATIPWPAGDLLGPLAAADNIDQRALQAASDWAFDRATPEQLTLSLLVVHQGHIVHERYAPGVDRQTRTRTWSTAKSIAVTLIGMLVDEGRMSLDDPLPVSWLPELESSETDPRLAITLRHVLNMSSGLYPVDSFGMEYATGSGLAYWAGASSIEGMRNRGLVRQPGTFWDYENYDTLLAVYAMKQALGNQQTYLEFPRRALFDRIGMRSTLASTDRFGDFIMSSQVYTNARDLARFGLLYLNGGKWQGQQLLSEQWINFIRTPAPASKGRGSDYGGHWWLVPQGRDDVPGDAYATAGNRGQYVIVVPSHELVIVRRGLDYGAQGFDRWDLTREVLKAVPGRGSSGGLQD